MNGMMKNQELEKLFKAVANKRRVAIVKFLKRRQSGASLFEIADEIDLSFKATSKHLRMLLGVGFVEREQRGFRALFRMTGEPTPEARTVLSLIV